MSTEKRLAFETNPDRGFTLKAWYLPSGGDAEIELFQNGDRVRHFAYPAYKIWNLSAHFSEIVDSELVGDSHGYAAAGWTGFSTVMPQEITSARPVQEEKNEKFNNEIKQG